MKSSAFGRSGGDRKFVINDSNTLLNQFYRGQNYKIKYGYVNNNRCIVFCSSNGIYYPNTYAEFCYTIAENDRYEWENIGKSLMFDFEKIIFLRDVRKSYYVTGINSKINSIEKTLEFLSDEIKGYEVSVVGSSAGAYLAMILGSKLKIKNIFAIGGQYNFWIMDDVVNQYYYLCKYKNDIKYNQFFDISNIVKESNSNIFMFYSSNFESDVLQYKIVENSAQIHAFAINSDKHAEGPTQDALISMLKIIDNDKLCELSDYNSDRIWDKYVLSEHIIKLECLCEHDKEMLIPEEEQPILNNITLQTICHIEALNYFINPIVIYGAGEYGEKIYQEIRSHGRMKKVYICDKNDSMKDKFVGFINREDLPGLYHEENVIVLISIQKKNIVIEVVDWLLSIGIRNENIWTYRC